MNLTIYFKTIIKANVLLHLKSASEIKCDFYYIFWCAVFKYVFKTQLKYTIKTI